MEELIDYIENEELKELCRRYYQRPCGLNKDEYYDMLDKFAEYFSVKMHLLQDKMEKFVIDPMQDLIGFLWKDNNSKYQPVWCFHHVEYAHNIVDQLRNIVKQKGAEEIQDFSEWCKFLKQLKIL
ncbi:MAG: hypothetical protein MUO24_11300 [Desulfobacterales bacterium]|nr:hypothetical protein [Desulfobacterales bacterium]